MGLSVLMSVYGREKAEYLKEALQSLYEQTCPPDEIVLVKDGPLTEKLEQVIREFVGRMPEIKTVSLPESVQLGRALRKGLTYCSHDLVARMDSDDISLPNRFEVQCAYMKSHPEVDVLGGWIEEFSDAGDMCGIRQTPQTSDEIRSYLKFRNPMNHVTVMFRKSAVMEAGSYQHMPGFEDYDLWTRMLLKGRTFRNLPEIFVAVRTNPDMYRRRGGMEYFKRNEVFRKEQRKRGIINLPEYVLSLGVAFGVALQPAGLRKQVYQRFLRESSAESNFRVRLEGSATAEGDETVGKCSVEEEKLLTVVIPAYNVEQYLEACLESLLQTEERERTELLVVDDGSKDATGQIADDYQKKYPSIVRVIHKTNGGHGSAVNTGIEEALGKYLRVLDSDDCVESKAYESYLNKLVDIDCDLVATPFTCVWYQKEETGAETGAGQERIVKEKQRKIEGAGKLNPGKIYLFPEVADRLYIRMHEWTIRTSILKEHNIRLTEHCFYVDAQYVLYPVPWITTVCILSENVYRYRLGMEGQSVSMKSMQKNRKQHRKVLDSLMNFYREREKFGDRKEILVYLARGIAKMEADEVQITLSMPIGKEAKKELLTQEKLLKQECPAAYLANEKSSVWLLRRSGYLLYPVAALLWKLTRR